MIKIFTFTNNATYYPSVEGPLDSDGVMASIQLVWRSESITGQVKDWLLTAAPGDALEFGKDLIFCHRTPSEIKHGPA